MQQPHEYSDQVGLLIRTKRTDRYAPEFTVFSLHEQCVTIIGWKMYIMNSKMNSSEVPMLQCKSRLVLHFPGKIHTTYITQIPAVTIM